MNWQEFFTKPLEEMWIKFLAFVPNLLGALVILLVGAIIARIIRTIVERGLRMARFDTLTDRAGINQALEQGQITTKPSGIVGKLFYWIVMLVTLMMAVNALGLAVATELLSKLLDFIPNLIAALFILALGFFFGGLIRSFVATLAGGVRAVNPQTVGKVAQAAVIIFVVDVSLKQLGIATDIIDDAIVVVLAALGLGLALAFGLGCKDMVKNWVESITRK
ncbi:hypothetical protein MYX77_07935 [Acidobacteriia bacterium AH_259_A11_L15]|nr:hypothetical protein [Acidobacteriia bacterium AH_259_A11_L15]